MELAAELDRMIHKAESELARLRNARKSLDGKSAATPSKRRRKARSDKGKPRVPRKTAA